MVYKVTKGGVRSGNTLRGLHSYKTRRYSTQACIVGRSNIKTTEVPAFLDSHIEDEVTRSSLGSTDVALSLNKKKRWLLPATVGHMIKTGSFNDEKTMVSLLERHKLKRRANCVSFVCNQGKVRHVAPRQKRYFSFKLDNIGNVLSNRQKKRQILKTKKQVKSTTRTTFTKESRSKNARTEEVFTLSRSGDVADFGKVFESSKPELRLEVFYPCPKSCSLTYNPKYTNVHMEFGEEGEMQLKANNKKVVRKGRRRRKRLALKDFSTYDPDTDLSDAEEFWSDATEDCQNRDVPVREGNASFSEVKDSSGTSMHHFLETDGDEDVFQKNEKYQGNENVIASMIMQAEKAKSLCEGVKSHRKTKQSFKRTGYQHSAINIFEKSHIVYTSDGGFKYNRLRTTKETAPSSTTTAPSSTTTAPSSTTTAPSSTTTAPSSTTTAPSSTTTAPSSTTTAPSSTTTAPSGTTTNYPTLTPARVVLKSEETTPGNLGAKFGRFYAEAESEPRRFVIDVTEDVQSLVCQYRNAEESAVFTSFLVFVHDGVYDEGLDTFKVIFNSNCCPETIDFKDNIPFREISLEEIMNRFARTVLDMKNENLIVLNYEKLFSNATVPKINVVNRFMNVNVTSYYASDEIRRVSQTEVMQENVDYFTSLENIFRDLDCDIFCDICYESINPTQAWDVSGTRLLKCSHIFCDDCWRSHLRAKLKDGSVKMACPGYDCDETVGPVTMLSLLHVSEVSKFFQRKCEEEADSSTNSRWCPNRDCGRVIKLDTERSTKEMSIDVVCFCGHEFCFSCLSHSHWPATCEQAENYSDRLQTLESVPNSTDKPNSEENQTVLEIEGRLCPKCSKFIEKNGGCKHMSCMCGHQFCWLCMQDMKTHKVCKPTSAGVFNSTLRLKFRHLVIPKVFSLSEEDTNKPKAGASRQKTTLYRKALQERKELQDSKYKHQIKEMVNLAAHVARKDLNMKREILSLCGVVIDNTDTDSVNGYQVVPHMTKFLRSCCEIKRALHHVAEFTFVLLQDTADSVDKRRTLRLANDLSGYCSFIRYILESGQKQDMGAAVKRLADIQTWAKRALTALLINVHKLRR